MWVCSVCGLELDDGLESCPFGCGPRGTVPKGEKRDDANAQKAAGKASESAATYPMLGGISESIAAGSKPKDVIPLSESRTNQQSGAVVVDADSILVLTEGRTGNRIEIESLACVLGRDGDYGSELFSEQVSRVHMEISHADGGWKGCHVGLNPSVLVTPSGRINMEHGIEYPLHNGDRPRIANQTFMVGIETKEKTSEELGEYAVEDERLGSETSCSNPRAGVASNDDMTECWCVSCPKCGAKHQVRGADDQLAECRKCTDPMDRREIRRITPAFGSFKREELIDAR